MTWRSLNKPIFAPMRRASRDFGLLEEGDRICISVSGGKDSTFLLYALSILQRTLPTSFSLHPVLVDMGWGVDWSPLEDFAKDLGLPITILPTDIGPIVFKERQEANPCSLCSRMRRGAVNRWANSQGCNKVALGHHRDDCIETLLMSLFYEGRVHTFAPRSYLDRMDVTVIRPLALVAESDIIKAVSRLNLPIIANPCPAEGQTTRDKEKILLAQLEQDNPLVRDRMMAAILRDIWAPYRITP